MDPKKLEEFCRQHGEVVRHADARSVDKRVHLEETESQPIVVKRLLPLPHDCEDCGKSLPDRKVRSHYKKGDGWRSHCSGCNRSRQPGSDTYGQVAVVKVEEGIKPNRLGPREELLPVPIQPQHPEPLSTTIETSPTSDSEVEFVEQVVVRDYHESVITEYSRIPVLSQHQLCDAPDSDSVVRTN